MTFPADRDRSEWRPDQAQAGGGRDGFHYAVPLRADEPIEIHDEDEEEYEYDEEEEWEPRS